MRDIITKLAILVDLLRDQYGYWRREIWANDLDTPYCCDGRECGCMAQTNRDIFRPTSNRMI
jgi:hypothetical protein